MKRHRLVSLAIGLTATVAGVVASAPLAAASSTVVIYNFLSKQCLQPVNGSTEQGAAIVQEPCNGSVAQQWTEVSVGSNIFHYVNGLSGWCLDARGRAVNGTPVQQWTCNNISNEKWQPGEYISDVIPPLISRVPGSTATALTYQGAGPAMRSLPLQRDRSAAMVDRSTTVKPITTKGV